MIKQFQSRILKLEETIELKEKQFTKKKQTYQRIIQELQTQNQKLKSIITDLNKSKEEQENSKLNNSHSKIQNESPQQGQLSEYEFREQEPHITLREYTQVVEHNNYLKQQIAQLSTTYEKQIQSLTIYFQKIKSSNRLSQSYATDIAQSKQVNGKVSLLMSAYESLLKGFDSERQKFIEKIEELSKYIIWAEEKNKKLVQEKILLEKRLNNSHQTLRLFKHNLSI